MKSLNEPEPPPSAEPSDHPACWDLVLAHPSLARSHLIPLRKDMEERDQQGAAKYGVRLHPFNGRDALVDLYQELLDASVYAMQAIYESQHAVDGETAPEYWKRARRERVFELVVCAAELIREQIDGD